MATKQYDQPSKTQRALAELLTPALAWLTADTKSTTKRTTANILRILFPAEESSLLPMNTFSHQYQSQQPETVRPNDYELIRPWVDAQELFKNKATDPQYQSILRMAHGLTGDPALGKYIALYLDSADVAMSKTEVRELIEKIGLVAMKYRISPWYVLLTALSRDMMGILTE